MTNAPNNPLVSIIVRTKDRPKLLKRALKSVSVQVYRHLEVILVNDGGCDLDVLELRGILGDIPLNYVRLEKNMGRSHAGNAGIENAKGKYVGFLDDDDEFYEDHVSTLLPFLIKDDDYAGVYSDSEMIQREYDDKGNIANEDNKGVFRSCGFSYEVLLFENYIPLMCILLRREHLKDLGGFDESFEMFEDWDLFIRASEKKPFYHIRKISTKYIQWSKIHQIAFINAPNAPASYLKVLSKHSSKITPEAAYRYFLVKQEEIDHTKNMSAEEISNMTDKLQEAAFEIGRLSSENAGLQYKVGEEEARNQEFGERLKEAEATNEEFRDTLKVMTSLIEELSSKNVDIERKLGRMQTLQEELRDRQGQMQTLQEELRDKQGQMQTLQETLRDNQGQMQTLQEALRDKQAQIRVLQEELRDKQIQIHGFQKEELRDKQVQMQTLQDALRDKQVQVQTLQEELRDRQVQKQTLQDALRDKQVQVQTLQEELGDRQIQMQTLQKELRDRQMQIYRLKDELLEKTVYIEEVQSGIGWTILEYYRQNVRDVLAPVGTRRRTVYDYFVERLKKVKRISRKTIAGEALPPSLIKKEIFIVPKIGDCIVPLLNTKVSVVIPTKDAGPDFQHVLEGVRKQRGLRDIEIIIVDSGSKDGTLSLARRYNSQIFSIRPSEFGHGKTRNYGGQFASGEYVVFLSQDAIPIGDICFSSMIQGMKNDPRIAAVSGRQVPRSDADLFACWQIWNHYERFLKYSEDEVVSVDPKAFDLLDPSDKRRVAQIDNVFSCIRTDILKEFTFRDLKYAEDLDLGLRLVRNGYKIGFLSSVGAIHSHNRNLLYQFKRSYIDRKALSPLLNSEPSDWHALGIDSFKAMVQYVQSTYRKIDNTLGYLAHSEVRHNMERTFLDSLSHLVQLCPSNDNGSAPDTSLRFMIDEMLSTLGANGSEVRVVKDVMLLQFFEALESFKEYLSFHEAGDKFDEIVSSLYKLCAVVVGSNMGDYAAFSEERKADGLVSKLEQLLGDGV